MEFVRVQTAGTAHFACAQFSAYLVRFDGGLWPWAMGENMPWQRLITKNIFEL